MSSDTASHLGLKVRRSANGTFGLFRFCYDNTKDGRVDVIFRNSSPSVPSINIKRRMFLRTRRGVLTDN